MKHPSRRLGNTYEIEQPPPGFSYGNVMSCGSVWHCPVCAAKISEKRRQEVAAVIAGHNATGGEVLLLTLTLPHRINQPLKAVLDVLTRAYNGLTKSRAYRDGFKQRNELTGSIRATEVTFGKNGWHPHLHVLLFVKSGTDLEKETASLATEWRRQVVRLGFDAPNHHGLTLENGDRAANYVGKWGLEHEVTKSHIKKSREGLTPFDLLRVLAGSRENSDVDIFEAAKLFREYANTFKGKKQLFWSQGLRSRFHLGEEKTDQELSDLVDVEATVFARLPLNVWRIILWADKRGEVLQECQKGHDSLFDFIIEIMESSGEIEGSS